MNHVWFYEKWKDLNLSDVKENIVKFSHSCKSLGDITVSDLCCLAKSPHSPIGIYVFIDSDKILYTGKTHGRSFHERMVSHLDHRKPVEGSPHLAQLVQSILKSGDVQNSDEAVQKVLKMKIVWMPVPQKDLESDSHKKLIAAIERMLQWHKCLDPAYNSPRVKKNDTFSIKGKKYNLSENLMLGDFRL